VHNKLAEDGNSPQALFQDADSPLPPPKHHPPPLGMVTRTNTNKIESPKYEAFMMTGERVIRTSKPQVILFFSRFSCNNVMTIILFRYSYIPKGIEKSIVW